MRFARILGSFVAAAFVALTSVSAWAQTYTVTGVSNSTNSQWATPPGTVNSLSAIHADDAMTSFSIPFAIPYWGVSQPTNTTIYVCSNGYCGFNSALYTYLYSPITYPYSSGSNYDGMIAVAQGDGDGRNSTSPSSSNPSPSAVWWQDTVGGVKRLTIAWLNWNRYSVNGGNSLNFQVQFYETGKIIMAYTGTWLISSSWGYGMDNPYSTSTTYGTGYITPSGSGSSSFTSKPANDYIYQPPIINITGTVTYDRYVVNSTGIGNQSETNLPLANIRIEQRDPTGLVLASAFTDSLGNFTMQGKQDPLITTGSVVIASGGVASNVRSVAGGAMYAIPIATNLSFANNLSLGLYQVNEAKDPGGTLRAPVNIARSIQQVYDGAKQLTAKAIPQLEVLYTSSISQTSYTAKVGLTPALMRVSGASSNPDPWDASVIRKTYARHVLGNIAADPGTPFDSNFDATTDDFNAFAEGFGYYCNAVISGEQIFYDGINNTTLAQTIDIENPSASVLTKAPSSAVAGWCAAALFDLFDPANENWDTIDGTGLVGLRPFQVVAGLSAPVSATTFTTAWNNNVSYDRIGLVRNFIHHGLIADDADEPNDSIAEPRGLTQFGIIRKDRVMAPFNEDWYSFTMPDPTNKLSVSVVLDRTKYASTVLTLEVRNAANSVIMTGVASGALGPYVAESGALPAGTYRVRVAVTAGTPIDKYTLQAFSELAFKSGAFQPWTIGRPINVPVDIKGGIPPYNLTVLEPFKKPDGLILDGVNLRVGGIPTGPQAAPIPPGGSYTYGFILSAQDAATPPNTASGPINFTVNDTLKSHVGEFLAVPYDKPLSREAPFAGGTAPFTTSIDEGLMPHGISFAPDELRLVGTADIPGSYPVQITATDIALSDDTAQTTGVTCVPFGADTPLALGAGAAGFYFDAVQGSTVAIAVKTAPKSPKRLLRGQVLDTDGTTVIETRAKGGKGKASVKFVAPSTGRFFFVVASDTGDATTLVGNGKITAPTVGKGENPDPNFVAGKQYAVRFGALAGARLTFVGKPDKSGLALRALYLLDPEDNIVQFADGEVTEKKGTITVKKTLPTSETQNLSGTWRMIVGAYPGAQGHFTYSFKIVEPKGGAYAFD